MPNYVRTYVCIICFSDVKSYFCTFSCYYSTLIAWCFYYFIFFVVNDLPSNLDDSYKIWNDLQVHFDLHMLMCVCVCTYYIRRYAYVFVYLQR